MRLARTLRFDESDERVFPAAAEPDEWAVTGTFAFSNAAPEALTGKAKQAFANGWLGLDSFGHATFVAVSEITEPEFERAVAALARHFVEAYGAPDLDAAMPVARGELEDMAAVCGDHDPNTLLVLERELTDAGVAERIRAMKPQEATIDAIAVHGSLDD